MADPNVPVQGQDLVGQVLKGRYRIDAPLGEGGMASVFLASDLDFQPEPRRVVAKVPHAQLLMQPASELNLGNFKLNVQGEPDDIRTNWSKVRLEVEEDELDWGK